jgi:hypothetical protein
MAISIPEKPPLLVGNAVNLGPPQRPQPTLADRERLVMSRPPVQGQGPAEFMGVPMMAAGLFQGPAPKVGDAVELVCVRADARGWGLALRVKDSNA